MAEKSKKENSNHSLTSQLIKSSNLAVIKIESLEEKCEIKVKPPQFDRKMQFEAAAKENGWLISEKTTGLSCTKK